MLSWMAWTWPTALAFIALFSALGVLTVLEIRHPGGDERLGALGLVTTRGDRLFISCLGLPIFFLPGLVFFGTPLWIPLILALGWGIFCFRKV